MQVEILKYIIDDRGAKKGNVDFKIIYTPDKWEIFRNVSYFEKDNRKWLSLPNTKRDETWVALYERSSEMKPIFEKVLEAMKNMVDRNEVDSPEEESVFPF